MFKGSFQLVLALLLVTVLSSKFDDIVNKNKEYLSYFWGNNVALDITGRQNTMDLVASDITPLVWSGNSVIAAYLNRNRRQALMMPKILVDKLFREASCDSLCFQWRMIILGFYASTEEATAYFAKAPSKRSKTNCIIITDTSTGFDPVQVMKDWEAGNIGPLIFQHFNMEAGPSSNVTELAYRMGFYFKRDMVDVQSVISGLRYEPVPTLMPFGLTLQVWTDNATTVETYPPRFNPFNDDWMANRLANYPSYAESVYAFIQKYDKLIQDNPVTEEKPIKKDSSHPFSVKFYINYVRQSYSQALKLIDKERLSKLTYNYGVAGGFLDKEGLTVPTVGEYLVKLDCKNNINTPLRLDIKPHTTIEYEIVTNTNEPMDIGAGALYDGLSDKDTLYRVPVGRASEVMTRKDRFYSPIGGPLIINPRQFRGKLEVKLKNVYRSTGMDIKDETTVTAWDNGTFTNSKARFATLLCDVIYFTVEHKVIKNFTSQGLKDICTAHDHMVKAFENYVGAGYSNRERYHFVFDPQPIWGAAHSGQPMVLPTPWTEDMIELTNHYIRDTPTDKGWWGLLHELGHMFQSDYWDFGIFGETTNNVLVLMFQERYLKIPYSMRKAHPKMYELSILFNYINGVEPKMHQIWAGLHFHYHLVPSFGWGIFGNVYNRYVKENNPDTSFDRFTRYLSEETGYNMAPYMYYFRLSYLAKNITAVYQQYTHLPTFKPYDLILNGTTARWSETKQFFGFTNDQQVNISLEFKFDPNNNFDSILPASPVVVAV